MPHYSEYLAGHKKGGKRMKKKYGILALALTAALTLSACGGKEEPEAANQKYKQSRLALEHNFQMSAFWMKMGN